MCGPLNEGGLDYKPVKETLLSSLINFGRNSGKMTPFELDSCILNMLVGDILSLTLIN